MSDRDRYTIEHIDENERVLDGSGARDGGDLHVPHGDHCHDLGRAILRDPDLLDNVERGEGIVVYDNETGEEIYRGFRE